MRKLMATSQKHHNVLKRNIIVFKKKFKRLLENIVAKYNHKCFCSFHFTHFFQSTDPLSVDVLPFHLGDIIFL